MKNTTPPVKRNARPMLRLSDTCNDICMKYSTGAFILLIIFAIGFVVGFAVSRKYSPSIELPVVTIKTDTATVGHKGDSIIRVDTVRLQINPAKENKYQIDTTTRKSKPDTVTRPH